LKFPGQARASIIQIPKFGQPTGYPNASYCLPTTKPPKELIVEISEIRSLVE